jgi:sarcosine oxidase gamma subunit
MTDPTAPVTPRTEAGRRLAARAKREAWGNWEGIAQFEIPAIEREAGSTDALRQAHAFIGGITPDEWATIDKAREAKGHLDALAASDAGPAGIDVTLLRRTLVELDRILDGARPTADQIAAEYDRLSRESDR